MRTELKEDERIKQNEEKEQYNTVMIVHCYLFHIHNIIIKHNIKSCYLFV